MNAEFFKPTPQAGTVAARAAPSMRNPLSRRTHRWVSMIFTAMMALNFAVMAFGAPPPWITYAPLPPLRYLLITGLIMLMTPWVASLCRSGRAASARE